MHFLLCLHYFCFQKLFLLTILCRTIPLYCHWIRAICPPGHWWVNSNVHFRLILNEQPLHWVYICIESFLLNCGSLYTNLSLFSDSLCIDGCICSNLFIGWISNNHWVLLWHQSKSYIKIFSMRWLSIVVKFWWSGFFRPWLFYRSANSNICFIHPKSMVLLEPLDFHGDCF
jgi:hypothetical protein